MESRIIKVAHLVEFISRKDVSRADKVEQIKILRNDGIVTQEEAIDLCIEYL